MIYFSAPPRTDIVQAENVRLKWGAVGDGVTDDSAAFRAALATGKSVYAPPPPAAYRFGSNVIYSAQYGQQLFGDGPEITPIVCDVNVNGLVFGAQGQWARDLSLAGPGMANTTASGIYLPGYFPYWGVDNVFIRDFKRGLNNQTVNGAKQEAADPTATSDPGGSDAGKFLNSKILRCDQGFFTWGNKDYTPIRSTSIDSCPTAGIQVDGDGRCSLDAGVIANCGTPIYVKSGAIYGQAVHIEGNSTAPGFRGYGIDVGINCSAQFNSIFSEKDGDDANIFDIHCVAGSRVDLYGDTSALRRGSSGGDGVIRSWGGPAGSMIISVNPGTGAPDGVSQLPAGPYDYANTLPTPSSVWRGRHFALLTDGSGTPVVPSVDFEEYACEYIAGSYAWTPVTNRRAYSTTSDPHVAGKLWNNLGLATFSGG